MKINTRKMSYEEVTKLPKLKHKKPLKPSRFLATVVRIVSDVTLKQTKFSYTTKYKGQKFEPLLFRFFYSNCL